MKGVNFMAQKRNAALRHKAKKRAGNGYRAAAMAVLLLAAVFFLHKILSSEESVAEASDGEGISLTAASPLGASSASQGGTEEAPEVLDKLQQMAGEDEIVAEILGHTEEYPASLLEMLSKNEETAQFVLDYPDKKDNPPAETIGDVTRGEIPLLIQWDERWGYTTYGSGLLAVTGCGPTCLSMVAAGLNGDSSITPWRVAEFAVENGYYVEGVGSAWSLMTEGCREYGLEGREIPLDEGTIRNELAAGNAIICSMLPGDFTTSGHFIVIAGMDGDGFVVNDPNSRIRSDHLWSYEELSWQIGNLWTLGLA